MTILEKSQQKISFLAVTDSLYYITNQMSTIQAQSGKELLLFSQVRPRDYFLVCQKLVIVVVFQISNLYLHSTLIIQHHVSHNVFQEMVTVYLIFLSIWIFAKINGSYKNFLKQNILLIVSILGVQLSVLLRANLATLIFTISSISLFYLHRDDKHLIGPMFPICVQLFFILARLDKILMVPWWLLVFQVPIMLVVAAYAVIQMPLEFYQSRAKRQAKAWSLKEIFLFKSVFAFYFSIFLFLALIFNEVYLSYDTNIYSILSLCFIASFIVFMAIFWQEIIYVLSQQHSFQIVVRNYQNTFLGYRANNSVNTTFSDELCNKCSLREANIISLSCLHLCLCIVCVETSNNKTSCLICKKETSYMRIELLEPLQHKAYKISFYQKNQFKVYDI